ncbi:hypothetical protein SAMN06265795_11688 [Noviherbaspirillum humi]|uniref:Uncharacterized protein n=1 Tax=Noviherbaspirillum humi TaxID=1688639 RepID=A0A239KM72_9BURK|nr:hypothetical protein [Noviherbaspirillum humi]SNT19145.1 hypothetical protein SAMN06265795_11688 [Noviherbaspirillum humi]
MPDKGERLPKPFEGDDPTAYLRSGSRVGSAGAFSTVWKTAVQSAGFDRSSPMLLDVSTNRMLMVSLPAIHARQLGFERRCFIYSSALVVACRRGVAMVRKPGRLPTTVISDSCGLEYGTDRLEIEESLLPTGALPILVSTAAAIVPSEAVERMMFLALSFLVHAFT